MATAAKADMSNNMRIWDAVSRTDPAHTKAVEFGRKFTAIDAHYQIMEATRQFGPVGEGWGYDTGELIFADGLVIVPVTLWHGQRDNTFGPIYGSTTLRDRKGNVDKDAPKKATTDALTKALSQLGFNADVFLGKFDDNKYVEQMREEFAPANDGADQPAKRQKLNGPYTSKTALWAAVKAFDRELNSCGDLDQLEALLVAPETVALVEQVERDAAKLAHGGDDLPEEFEPLHPKIARLRAEFGAFADDDSWRRNPVRAG